MLRLRGFHGLCASAGDAAAPRPARVSRHVDPATHCKARHIVLGLTGGIACYKSAELVRELVKAGATVQVVMTEAATQFITAVTMQALQRPPGLHQPVGRAPAQQHGAHRPHARGRRRAGGAGQRRFHRPAGAGPCRRTAEPAVPGAAAAERCPLLVAPAMNREMWAHPATQRNVAQIVADGATVLGPAAGDQACGEVGDGRMLEAAELLRRAGRPLPAQAAGRPRVLITAGPTFEAIDPVRGITNHSSGKMGFAIARAAAEAGAAVTLVAGPVHLPTPRGVRRIDVQSAAADAAGRAARGAAARHLRRHRRGGRLAPRGLRRAQDQEGRQRPAARADSPRTPTSWPPWPACLPPSGRGAWASLPRATTSCAMRATS